MGHWLKDMLVDALPSGFRIFIFIFIFMRKESITIVKQRGK
jgi:hypothetical protein